MLRQHPYKLLDRSLRWDVTDEIEEKESTEAEKNSIMFRFMTPLNSSGKTDIIRVCHMVIRIRKLNPKVATSL